MNLLGAILYDPAISVNKVTTAALAMTAIDTVNLRLAITVPAHGKVRFRLMAVIHGAATFPSILMGVMVGAAVKGRVAPVQSLGNTAVATALLNVEADFIVTGLAPGATNFDAAYGVETLVAATGLKYGGADNNVANDAFGGFVFEAWDPQPMTAGNTLTVDANGRVDISKVSGTAQTARDLGAQLDATVSSRLAPTVAARTLDVSATGEAGLDWANIGAPTTAQNLSGTTISASQVAASVTAAVTLPAIPNNWITAAGINAAALNGKGDWLLSSGYTAPDNAGITTLLTRLSAVRATNLDSLDAAVSSRLATVGYTAPDNAGIAVAAVAAASADTKATGIKAKTDSLTFTLAGKLDGHVLAVNGIALQGVGTVADPWRAA